MASRAPSSTVFPRRHVRRSPARRCRVSRDVDIAVAPAPDAALEVRFRRETSSRASRQERRRKAPRDQSRHPARHARSPGLRPRFFQQLHLVAATRSCSTKVIVLIGGNARIFNLRRRAPATNGAWSACLGGTARASGDVVRAGDDIALRRLSSLSDARLTIPDPTANTVVLDVNIV